MPFHDEHSHIRVARERAVQCVQAVTWITCQQPTRNALSYMAGESTGVSISTELLLLCIVGEVIVRVDGLVEESDAVRVVICRRSCEIARSVPQEDPALVVMRQLFRGEAYCGILEAVSIGTQVVKLPYISSDRSSVDQALVMGLQSTDLHDIGLDPLTWFL